MQKRIDDAILYTIVFVVVAVFVWSVKEEVTFSPKPKLPPKTFFTVGVKIPGVDKDMTVEIHPLCTTHKHLSYIPTLIHRKKFNNQIFHSWRPPKLMEDGQYELTDVFSGDQILAGVFETQPVKIHLTVHQEDMDTYVSIQRFQEQHMRYLRERNTP